MILAPGIFDMPAAQYHADPCPDPSLSASIAHILLTRSPRHVWCAHPRLGAQIAHEDKPEFDLGTAAHALLLEGDTGVSVIDADSFRSKDAREQRDAAYAAGKTPLLKAKWDDVQAMAVAARAQLTRHIDASDALTAGSPERVLIWQESGVWCRARADWLFDSGNIDDFKTTSGSAHPDAQGRRLFDLGADLQAAWYMRGVRALGLSDNPRFRFIVQETAAPYALSVLQLDPAALALAEKKVDAALELWSWCLANDRWPGYPAQTCFIGAPVWQEKAQIERESRAELAGGSLELNRLALDWQAPLTGDKG